MLGVMEPVRRSAVLVVDDNALELLGMQQALEKAGFEAIPFQIKSFGEAFKLSELVLDREPTVILMDVDIGLSSYDGVRLAKTIARLREPGEKTPLIVLHSSLSAAELLAHQRNSGADTFLEKGDLQSLPGRIRRILVRLGI